MYYIYEIQIIHTVIFVGVQIHTIYSMIAIVLRCNIDKYNCVKYFLYN